MAANKEAIALVVDVSSSMNVAPHGQTTALQHALDAITLILQRKMFSESKDEVALILFGTADTDNPLADGENYQNIVIGRSLGVPDFDLFELVQNNVQASDNQADFIDAMVVAMDHLVQSTVGKKGFATKRLILLSNFCQPFADDQLDTIVKGLQNSGTQLNIIGPQLNDDDDDDNDGNDVPPTIDNNFGKEKSPQQRAGEAMIKHILSEVNGDSYSFMEALPALSYFQARQVRQTAWKVQLEIGTDLKIPVCGYTKIKDFKLKQSYKKVYAKDIESEVGSLRTYHKNDEEETEVEPEDMVNGFRYGNTLVPMSADDKENMKYRAVKCLKILGFTKAENIKRHHYLGDGTLVFVAEKGDEAAAVALSALINALYETNSVMIARRVYAANSAPRIGCLIPVIKADYECLYWIELPFMEDLRQFTFGSLPLTDDAVTNKKFKPTDEQLQVMDDLITSMDLSQKEDDDNSEEILKPKYTFNPYFQRLYQCLLHRALKPDEGLPELSPLIASYLKRPEEIERRSEKILDNINKLFKLEVVAQKKEDQSGEALFTEKGEGDGPAVKKQKLDDDLEGGMENIARAKVTEVGTVSPIEDFQALLSDKDEDLFEKACGQMEKRIEQIVMDSFGTQFYGKASDCVKAYRAECIKKSKPETYNNFIKTFKDILISKAKRDFWDQIVIDKQGLISKMECESSKISQADADGFMTDVKVEEETKIEPEDDADDLLDMM
ncbi:hypothetical protein SNE40_006287 [Patella caerulea]|uniref:ATP-dependent DNA helicase II subunit 2 n=1 Tax=Patella caerulea TaxID=87958 RepID=A0AAN8JWG7_PATCE